MATFNKRKPTKTKKIAARKRPVSKHHQAKKGFPFLATFSAFLLMGFIAYFIFAVDTPQTAAVINKPTQEKEEILPEKPQPKWEYEDTLKTRNIEIEMPTKQKNSRPYQMQCGSFRQQDDAEALKASIAFQGLSSQVKKTGNWYRVILGPYERKRLAEKNRHKLQRAKINGCQIWLWR